MQKLDAVPAFIERWKGVTGSERANYQLFVAGLCELLQLPQPEPASDDTRDNAYVFERRVTFAHGDGGSSAGFIDCYKRGAFVLEAKKIKAGSHTKGNQRLGAFFSCGGADAAPDAGDRDASGSQGV